MMRVTSKCMCCSWDKASLLALLTSVPDKQHKHDQCSCIDGGHGKQARWLGRQTPCQLLAAKKHIQVSGNARQARGCSP